MCSPREEFHYLAKPKSTNSWAATNMVTQGHTIWLTFGWAGWGVPLPFSQWGFAMGSPGKGWGADHGCKAAPTCMLRPGPAAPPSTGTRQLWQEACLSLEWCFNQAEAFLVEKKYLLFPLRKFHSDPVNYYLNLTMFGGIFSFRIASWPQILCLDCTQKSSS